MNSRQDKRSTFGIWMDTTRVPAERLHKFDQWLTEQLANRLTWPRDSVSQARDIQQGKQFVLLFVRHLERNGFLFDANPLAALIIAKLDEIGELQRRGNVTNLWPYLRAIFSTYCGAKAEELRAESMQLGCHVSQILANAPKSIPQLEAQRHAETLREQLAKQRRRTRAAAVDRAQGRFL